MRPQTSATASCTVGGAGGGGAPGGAFCGGAKRRWSQVLSPLHLRYISAASPRYLRYISAVSPPYLLRRGEEEVQQLAQVGGEGGAHEGHRLGHHRT